MNKRLISKRSWKQIQKRESFECIIYQDGIDVILGGDLLGLSTSFLLLSFRSFSLSFLLAFTGLLRFLPHPSASLQSSSELCAANSTFALFDSRVVRGPTLLLIVYLSLSPCTIISPYTTSLLL